MERTWNKIAGEINGFFYVRRMRRCHTIGLQVKNKIDLFLKSKGIEFVSSVVGSSEPDWPKVKVKVLVNIKDYDEVLKLWEKLSEVGIEGINDVEDVFISVDQYENFY